MSKINPKHKDRLFSFIFGREENKSWALDLYNAINNTNHSNPDDVQIFSIENVLYMGLKNDVALIIDDVLSVYEQQSTYNPNMPIRELIYTSKLYNKYIKKNKLNIYSKSNIYLPVPKLVVFYNGIKDKEDSFLMLSNSFNNTSIEPDITVKVKMININYGKNAELLNRCKTLGEYSWFIERIRYHCEYAEISEAVNTALDEMPESFLIKCFLENNKAEVTDMCITEYNEAETLQAIGDEEYAKCKADDIEIIKEMANEGTITNDIANTIISKLSANSKKGLLTK